MVDIVEAGSGSEPIPITQRSHLAETMFSNPTAFSAPIRVFVPPAIEEAVRPKVDSVWHSAMEIYYSKKDALSDELQSDLGALGRF